MIPQPIDQVPLFLKLTEEERELLSSRLRHLEFNANNIILAANKPAEMMGVVTQGWVKLESETPQGRLALANLGAGSILGEVDLLLNRVSATTARAASNTHLLALSRQDLQDLILENPAIGLKFSSSLGARVAYLDHYLITQRLSTAPLLSALSEEELRALAAKLQFRSFPRGETVFEAGDAGDAVYLIEAGAARLITAPTGFSTTREGEAYEELKAGDLLGQTALLTGKPQLSTARAVTDVEAWVLQAKDYQELLHEYPTIKLAFARALAESLSSEDQTKATEQLAALSLFADVDRNALRELAARLELRHFPAGELIYAEGTPGDAMYFVESGEIRLVSDAAAEAELLDRKTAGAAFGEMALLTGRTRAEAAKSNIDTTLWVLYKSDYDDLIVQHPTLSLALSRALSQRLSAAEGEYIERHLHKLKVFAGLSHAELRDVAEYVKAVRFRPGETLCYAGQPAQYIYLIKSGEVREIAGGPNGQSVILDLLGAHQSFGEKGVIQNSAYDVTVQAVGEVECWTLAKADFDRLLAKYPALAMNIARRLADEVERTTRRRPIPVAPMPRATAPAPRPRPAPTATPTPPNRAPTAPRLQTAPQAPRPAEPTPAVGVRSGPTKPWDRTPNNVVRPMPAATARPLQNAAPNAAARPTPANGAVYPPSITSRFATLSTSAKLKMAIIAFAVFWLVIVLPLGLLITFLTSNNVAGIFSTNSSAGPELPMEQSNPATKQLGFLPPKFAVKERTATPTRAPATPVPTAKATVKPTRRAPTALKTTTTKQNLSQTNPTSSAAAPAAARAPLPPREWDKRVGPGGLPLLQGVGVTDASVASGQTFWRLVKMKFEDAGAESGNDHTIYISIIDETGKRLDDQSTEISWDEGGAPEVQHLGIPDQKPAQDYCQCNYNWPMYGAAYKVRIDGSLPSDKVYGMIMPMKRHVNYRLTFQRVIMP